MFLTRAKLIDATAHIHLVDKKLDKYSLAKNVLTLCFFILGAVLVLLELPGLGQVLLLLDATLLAFLLFDLNLPKQIMGINTVPKLRLILAAYGAIFFITFPAGAIGYIITIAILAVSLLAIPQLLWNSVDWTANTGRVQQTYEKLFRMERKKDARLEEGKVRIFHRMTLMKTDFLKILAFTFHLLEVLLAAIVLSWFIIALGYTYIMELSLLALFILWTSIRFWNLVIKHRFGSLWKRQEEMAEHTWMLLVKQVFTARGILYLSFFLPAILLAMAVVILTGQFSVAVIQNTFKIPVPWYYVAMSYAIIAVVFMSLLVNLTYPFYIIVKLFMANVSRKKRGGYRRATYLIASPSLCLLVSMVFVVLLTLPSDLIGLSLFQVIPVGTFLFIVATIFFLIVWTRVIILRRRGVKQRMSKKLEKQLALGMVIITLPIYRFLEIDVVLAFYIIFSLLLYLSEVFAFVKQEMRHKGRFTIETLAIFLLVAVYAYFFMLESTWLIALCASVCCLVLITWIPESLSDLVISRLLMVEEIKP